MKKGVFISTRMAGLTTVEIRTRLELAETYIREFIFPRHDKDDPFECTSGWIALDNPAIDGVEEVKPERVPVFKLGAAIKRLARCDAIVFWGDPGDGRGPQVEEMIAVNYGIPCYYVKSSTVEAIEKSYRANTEGHISL